MYCDVDGVGSDFVVGVHRVDVFVAVGWYGIDTVTGAQKKCVGYDMDNKNQPQSNEIWHVKLWKRVRWVNATVVVIRDNGPTFGWMVRYPNAQYTGTMGFRYNHIKWGGMIWTI